jgi:HEAT repeat protein
MAGTTMEGSFTGYETDSRMRWLRISRIFQIRLSRLMVLIAIAAVVLSAWLFNREYGSDQQAWTSSQMVALSDPDAAKRKQAAENLYRVELDDLSRTVAVLTLALADPDWQVRLAAARSLASTIGSLGGITNGALNAQIDLAARALIPACDDPRDEVRIAAMEALGKLYESPRARGSAGRAPVTRPPTGSQASRASDTLSRALQDTSPRVRAQALWSFARVGRISGAIVDPVMEMVESDSDQNVRIAAIDALSVGWPEDPRLYSLFLRRLKLVRDQDEHARIGWAFDRLDRPPLEALPALLEALSADDWILRNSIPVALGKLGAAAEPAVPDLARIARIELASDDGFCAAIEALRSIDPDSPESQALIEPLATLLRDSPSNLQRQKAMFLLMGFGRSAQAAVGPLQDALKSTNPDVRQRSIFVLGFVGPAATRALADLELLFRDDPDENVRRSAQDAMRKIKASIPANPVAEP